MKAKIAIVGVFLVAILGIVLFRVLGGESGGDSKITALDAASSASAGALASGAPRAGKPVEVSMLYSSEKREWLEAAAPKFRADHPEIKLTLTPKGSIDAAQALIDEKEKPTIFSPADSLVLNMAISDWKTKGKGDLVAESGPEAPESLVITPLVFVVWEERAQALLKSAGGKIAWKTIQKAVASNKGWPAVGGKPEWGFIKFGHTDPTKSNSGLQALYLMSLEFYGKPTLDVADLLKPDYQSFIKDIERGVTKFETSTGTFMTDMVRFGPSKYDIAVIYENLAISQIEAAQGRWGDLRVYYPSITLWSDHPTAVLKGDWVTPEQRAAAHTWLTYLRSRDVQNQALMSGFRPGDPAVPVKTADAQNPFTRLAKYGVQVEVPPVARAPEGAVVRNLQTMWTRLVAPGH